MSAVTHDLHDTWPSGDDDLLEAFLTPDTPEGFTAEIVEGEIVVTPPPDGDHETAIGRIVRQVHRHGEYTTVTGVPAGDPLPLPAPFGFTLATDRLT
ncbi:hypothetical protein KNE206_59070 [Kitasatospora sp. NE20-6]